VFLRVESNGAAAGDLGLLQFQKNNAAHGAVKAMTIL
jgi:hypothetical protein